MFRVGIGVGGTFTDLVAIEEESAKIITTKSPSTPLEPEKGVLKVLEKSKIKPENIKSIVHGTTIATNALIEKKLTTNVGFITTKGFKDIPFIQRTNRKHHYDLTWIKPKPFVLRENCFEVNERFNYKGESLKKINVKEAKKVIEECKRKGLNSIAVSLLFSFVNPFHEKTISKLINEIYPEAKISLSHEIDPQWREYDRASTTIINAYLRPLIEEHMNSLTDALESKNFKGSLMIMKSNGGFSTHEAASKKPISILVSGPVGGVLGGSYFGDLLNEPNIITIDMGGTSFDVSLIKDREVGYNTQNEVEFGIPIRFPMLDILAIGAGGGSKAWIDKGGLLRVGPASAGSYPGPICYGLGGNVPTVTDANLLLGRLNPDYFLGGEIKLDVELVKKPMKDLARRLSMEVYDLAYSIIRLIDNNMADAIRLVSIDKGHDPRDFVLLTFGGAGALHAASLARVLGIKNIIVPTVVGTFSTFGLLTSDMRVDNIQTIMMRSDLVDVDRVNDVFSEIIERAYREIKTEGYKGEINLIKQIEMRYVGQAYGLDVLVPVNQLSNEDFQNTLNNFHQTHRDKYGYSLDEAIEFTNFKVSAIGLIKHKKIKKIKTASKSKIKPRESKVWFDDGFINCPIFMRNQLSYGFEWTGPAIIEEETSTTLINPNDELYIDEYGNERIKIAT